MAPAKPPVKKSTGGGVGGAFSKKYGPLPLWAWAGILVAVVYIYRKYEANKSTTAATTASTGATPQTETITTAGGTYTGPAGQAPSSITNPNGSTGTNQTSQPATTSGTAPSTPGSPNTSVGTPGSTGGIPNTPGPVVTNLSAAQSYIAQSSEAVSPGPTVPTQIATTSAPGSADATAATYANNTVLANQAQQQLGLSGTPYASLTPAQQSQVQMYLGV